MPRSFLDHVAGLIQRVTTLFDRIGFAWLFVGLAIITLAFVVWINPPRLGLYLWWVSKVSGAAALGYAFDVAFFRGANPRYLDGIERSMAQQRRSVLIGCALIAAGLIG